MPSLAILLIHGKQITGSLLSLHHPKDGFCNQSEILIDLGFDIEILICFMVLLPPRIRPRVLGTPSSEVNACAGESNVSTCKRVGKKPIRFSSSFLLMDTQPCHLQLLCNRSNFIMAGAECISFEKPDIENTNEKKRDTQNNYE